MSKSPQKKDETVTGPSDEELGKKTEEVNLPLPMRQVLIPVDGTPQSEYMIDWALNNFCREGDQVNLIHIIPNAVFSSRRYPSTQYYAFEEYVPDLPDPDQEAAWRTDAEKYMAKKIYPMLKAAGFTAEVVAYETDNSSIGEIICERATDTDAAAVIMASHGKGRVREFFIGSVTNYCLHRCKKPVVIFRSPPTIDAQDPAADDKKKEGAPEKNGGAPSKKDADASQPHVHAE